MDEIARRAGVGMGTLYRRFPTKESLVIALFDERLDELATLAERAAELPPFDALEAYMAQACAAMDEDRGLLQVLAEHLRAQRTGGPGLEAVRARWIALLEPLVARAREAGDLQPEVDAADVAVLLRMLTAASSDAEDPGRGRARYLGFVLAGLRA